MFWLLHFESPFITQLHFEFPFIAQDARPVLRLRVINPTRTYSHRAISQVKLIEEKWYHTGKFLSANAAENQTTNGIFISA